METRMDVLIKETQNRINCYKDGMINDIGFVYRVKEMIDEYIESKIGDMGDQIDDLKGMMSYDR